jgi:hypothetical protein
MSLPEIFSLSEQVLILITSDIIHLEFGGPVFRGSFADFSRSVTVRILDPVFAGEFDLEKEIFGIF